MDDLIHSEGWRSRGYLPHFDAETLIQTVTLRLIGTLPRAVVEAWKAEIEVDPLPDRALRLRIERYLDEGRGECWLGRTEIAEVMEGALLHFDGDRYRLLAWVIMPNHLHLVVQCLPGWPLARLVESWKSFSARAINRILARTGPVWFPDYFDRFVRDERHLAAAVEYVHQNPVKAGLVSRAEEWPHSSARRG